jgi:ParB-like chromosome segregation protein Spo0J
MNEKKMTWRDRLSVHPAAERFDLLEGDDLAAFVADIKKHGILEPIKVMKAGDGWMVLDGRNRLNAAEIAGIEMFMADGRPIFPGPFKAVGFASDFDPVAYIISENIHRRHPDESQRSMIAAKIANLKQGDNQHTAIAVSSPPVSQAKAATLLNVSVDSVQRAAVVQREGSPELVKQVERGEVSVSAAAKTIKAAGQTSAEPQLSDATMAFGASERERQRRRIVREISDTLREWRFQRAAIVEAIPHAVCVAHVRDLMRTLGVTDDDLVPLRSEP